MASLYIPSTPPLRLTPKSPRSPTSPSPFSSSQANNYMSPISIISGPSTPIDNDNALSNPRRAPSPPQPPKRMKSTPTLLQQRNSTMIPRENNNAPAAREEPIVAPKVRQSRVGRLSGRLGGLVLSSRKGRPSNQAESGLRIEISSTRFSTATKPSPTLSAMPMENNNSARPFSPSILSPTSPIKRRKWPFTSSSFWPRPSAQPALSGSSASSHRDSSDTSASTSSEEDDLILEEDESVLSPRDTPQEEEMPPHQRSASSPLLRSSSFSRPSPRHSQSAPLPEKSMPLGPATDLPTITVTLPPRSNVDAPKEEYGRERTLSELFDGLFILSSGGKTVSTVSLSTINEQMDVPRISSEQEEEDFDNTDLISQESSSFETSGELVESPNVPLTLLRRTSSAPSLTYLRPVSPTLEVTPPQSPEEENTGMLRARQSSSALPLILGFNGGAAYADRTIAIPTSPCSPIHEGVSPVYEEAQSEDEEYEEHAIYICNDDNLHSSLISDDQWTLRAESIATETAAEELLANRLPRYSQLLHSPSQVDSPTEYSPVSPLVVDDRFKSQMHLADVKAASDLGLFTPPKSPSLVFNPPPRLASLALPPARPLRSLLRSDIAADDRTSQQWDREKVTQDIRQVVQRLRWDKAQKTWQLVREAEHTPPTRGRISNVAEAPLPRNTSISSIAPLATRATMLPPGKMEWGLVDSAAPSNTGHPGLLFRVCIAWRVTPEHNAVRHPFGAQEELKVFVLGRTSEEFYQLYEGLMGRFMLEPRRHEWTQPHEMGPKAMGCLEPMEVPVEEENFDFTTDGAQWEATREAVRRKVDALESWMQGLMRLKHTNVGHVLESEFIRAWMAPRREGDCERSVDRWRKDGHGEIGRDSEGIAKVLERLW
ncbi:hypothetical protein M408DRAFT_331757 [Serendipita vermifera MAFF 305830]|uniref:Uncharacterized protein n=1 Tax=Serendipita vermifera MAFF 305830 TaxID=933852 RepID=A0A0C2WDJ1_SERVB|nr:hypothetical protein M408DRAFT_331757 [Serendipita vermifera MAFF 305830]